MSHVSYSLVDHSDALLLEVTTIFNFHVSMPETQMLSLFDISVSSLYGHAIHFLFRLTDVDYNLSLKRTIDML